MLSINSVQIQQPPQNFVGGSADRSEAGEVLPSAGGSRLSFSKTFHCSQCANDKGGVTRISCLPDPMGSWLGLTLALVSEQPSESQGFQETLGHLGSSWSPAMPILPRTVARPSLWKVSCSMCKGPSEDGPSGQQRPPLESRALWRRSGFAARWPRRLSQGQDIAPGLGAGRGRPGIGGCLRS